MMATPGRESAIGPADAELPKQTCPVVKGCLPETDGADSAVGSCRPDCEEITERRSFAENQTEVTLRKDVRIDNDAESKAITGLRQPSTINESC